MQQLQHIIVWAKAFEFFRAMKFIDFIIELQKYLLI